ncbi:MAG: hypothetical protein NTV86_14235 [Planctomycetota bacterium]|nr:hypothetical protein [Planctomycetota bacterium]
MKTSWMTVLLAALAMNQVCCGGDEAPPAGAASRAADPAGAWKATMGDVEKIVGRYKGVYDKPPSQTPTTKIPDGPLLGNGDVGVALGGPPEELRLFISKADFWRTQGPPKCPNTAAGPRQLGQIVLSTPPPQGRAARITLSNCSTRPRGLAASRPARPPSRCARGWRPPRIRSFWN